MGSHRKLLIGVLVGAVLGGVAHFAAAGHPVLVGVVNYAARPIGDIFLRMLTMLAIPIVFSGVVIGIAELDLKRLGSVGLRTLLYTVIVSTIAVGIGLSLVNAIRPGGGETAEVRALAISTARHTRVPTPPEATGIDLLVRIVPDNPIGAAASGDMMAVIVFALLFGIGLVLTKTPATETLRGVFAGVYDVCMTLIELVMRLAPIGVGVILFKTMATLGFGVLQHIGLYVLVVLLGLGLQMFVVYPLVLRFFAGRNPREFFKDARLALVTAFATSSSSATLPTALRVAQEELGIPSPIARFVLTAGASMNQNGTALFEGVTVLFLAQLFGVDLSVVEQVQVLLVCVLGGIGTAGVPGGSLPIIAMILVMFRIPPEGLALIMGVDRFLDMCRTTLNVTGDLVAAAYVERATKAA